MIKSKSAVKNKRNARPRAQPSKGCRSALARSCSPVRRDAVLSTVSQPAGHQQIIQNVQTEDFQPEDMTPGVHIVSHDTYALRPSNDMSENEVGHFLKHNTLADPTPPDMSVKSKADYYKSLCKKYNGLVYPFQIKSGRFEPVNTD